MSKLQEAIRDRYTTWGQYGAPSAMRWIHNQELEPLVLVAIKLAPNLTDPGPLFYRLVCNLNVSKTVDGEVLSEWAMSKALPRVVYRRRVLLRLIIQLMEAYNLDDKAAVDLGRIITRCGWQLLNDERPDRTYLERKVKEIGMRWSDDTYNQLIGVARDYFPPTLLDILKESK